MKEEGKKGEEEKTAEEKADKGKATYKWKERTAKNERMQEKMWQQITKRWTNK